jgi:hypothetical protein
MAPAVAFPDFDSRSLINKEILAGTGGNFDGNGVRQELGSLL